MSRSPAQRRAGVVAALVLALLALGTAAAQARVLLVGSYHGKPGPYGSIQSAVDAARPGDWILVGPGDYHEATTRVPRGARGDDRAGAAVLIAKPSLHLRGMDRNSVVIDGTRSGAPRCSARQTDQVFGSRDASGRTRGRNGVVVYMASGVSVENLTVCNYPNGARGGGDLIWFDGGGASGQQRLGSFAGRYLSATSTYYRDASSPAASYGIYASNTFGPGILDQTYASNMSDASYYIGACPNCNVVLTRAHAQYSALGYSGTNSGGKLVVQNSEWDHNQSGIVTNSQNNDDVPSPQLGSCSRTPTPSTLTYCTFIRNNFIHDNNNPNVPQIGSAAFGPVGSGMLVAGGRYDTLQDNRIENNGSWGVLLVPYPDAGTPPALAHCDGGTPGGNGFPCFFDGWGNRVLGNSFRHNGFFGNPTNGDIGVVSAVNTPANCWSGNTDPGGLTATPGGDHTDCRATGAGESTASPLASQVLCANQLLAPCAPAPGFSYPRTTAVVMPPLARQRTMPNACAGVPANPWCVASAARRAPGVPHLTG